MGTTNKCKGCGKEFKTDPHNRDRQSYCRRQACQRLRRAHRQRQRRAEAVAGPPQGQPTTATSRLQTASDLSEADMRSQNPVIIGLISMITGTTDLESIEQVYRQCWLRGREILSASRPGTIKTPAVCSHLHEAKQDVLRTG